MRAFLPSWASLGDKELGEDKEEADGIERLANVLERRLAEKNGKSEGKEGKKYLDLMRQVQCHVYLHYTPPHTIHCVFRRWGIAFDAYAMGGATVQHQLTYASARAHKNTCMKLGLRAGVGTNPRRANFAVVYDAVARCALLMLSLCCYSVRPHTLIIYAGKIGPSAPPQEKLASQSTWWPRARLTQNLWPRLRLYMTPTTAPKGLAERLAVMLAVGLAEMLPKRCVGSVAGSATRRLNAM